LIQDLDHKLHFGLVSRHSPPLAKASGSAAVH
jgi:hypothetical protein